MENGINQDACSGVICFCRGFFPVRRNYQQAGGDFG